MKWFLFIILSMGFLFPACGNGAHESTSGETTTPSVYLNITQEQAKELMESRDDYVILDVRTQAEYDEKHIPGAILIPHDEILYKAESVLADKNQLILVYCRSGNRSKQASEDLVTLGYTYIREFGGINTWPYEVE